jgi:hypothetical protein
MGVIFYQIIVGTLPYNARNLVDLMGKLGVLSQFIDINKCVFLMNTWQKFHREAFEFLGLKTHWIGYDRIYQGNFLYPSLAGASGAIPRGTVLFLRSLFLNKTQLRSVNVGPYIYLSRGDAKRKILNEDSVFSELRKVAPFVFINAQDYTFAEQISIFNSAKFVIGSHGAGLINSIFMSEGSALIELLGPNYQAPMFKNMAHQSNLLYDSCGFDLNLMSIGQSVQDWDADYEFNIDGLLESVSVVYNNLKG